MKAIFINSTLRTVSLVDISDTGHGSANLDEMHALLSRDASRCDCFTTGGEFDNLDTVFVDDEGLLKPNNFFELPGVYPTPLAGNAIILGTNDEGESIDVKTSVETVRAMVKFYTPLELKILSAQGKWAGY